jgi:hypothetical protein
VRPGKRQKKKAQKQTIAGKQPFITKNFIFLLLIFGLTADWSRRLIPLPLVPQKMVTERAAQRRT